MIKNTLNLNMCSLVTHLYFFILEVEINTLLIKNKLTPQIHPVKIKETGD